MTTTGTRKEERDMLQAEKECLGDALALAVKGCEDFRDLAINRVYKNGEEQGQLFERIRKSGSGLMKLGACGNLTKDISKLGQVLVESATPKRPIPPQGVLYVWDEDYQKWVKKQCTHVAKMVKMRLNELSEALSKPLIFPPHFDDILQAIFPKHYKLIDITKVTAADRKVLKNYGDADIRNRLARILKKSRAVPRSEKAKLHQLAQQSHSGYEISDYGISLIYKGNDSSLHLVVKSGKEIKTKVNEKAVWYQITKPIDAGFDFVLFIAFAELTVPLLNRFRTYNKTNDCLRYIVGDELAMLFKSYDELA